MKKKRKDKPLKAGDPVMVFRGMADTPKAPATWLHGVARFVAKNTRFVTVEVELPPAAFRHESIRVLETYWPECVKKERRKKR